MTKKSYRLLRRMSFTGYEASIYVALTSKTRMNARDISKRTGVPITRAYGALESLATKGFIKSYPGRPRQFEAIPPDQAVKSFLEYQKGEYSKELLRIKSMGEELLHEIENNYWERLKIKPEEIMKPLSSLNVSEKETVNMINKSEDQVYILTAVFGWMNKVKKAIVKAVQRGVEFKILLLSPETKPENFLKEIPSGGLQVRLASTSWYPMRCTISDERKAIFVLWASNNRETFWNPLVFKPYLTIHPGIVSSLSNAFEKMWSESYHQRRITP